MNRDTRDFIGYGEFPPNAQWPNKARLAVSFVLNYEEGTTLYPSLSNGQILSDRNLHTFCTAN